MNEEHEAGREDMGTLDELAQISLPTAVYQFGIVGISPLLMHNPEAMKQGQPSGLVTKQIPSPEDAAEAAAYRLDDGQLYVPSIAFRSALWTGASGRKIGKVSARSVIAGSVFNATAKTPLFHPRTQESLHEYKVNLTRVVVQRSAVHRARPEIAQWACVLELELDTDLIRPEECLQGLNIAGRAVGVGDWRPERKGPYGRFQCELLGLRED